MVLTFQLIFRIRRKNLNRSVKVVNPTATSVLTIQVVGFDMLSCCSWVMPYTVKGVSMR